MKGRSKRGEKMGVEDAIVGGGSGVGGGASGWWDGDGGSIAGMPTTTFFMIG